ncbi:MAG TPA: hypothetical protein VK975_05135, partial [Acidimicrobiales bacterium]|nr:hypothetical protein [Acidimicrobiales bacterium]
HAWGERGWGNRSWCTSSGRFDDDTTWHAEEAGAGGDGGSSTLPGSTTMALDAGLEVTVRPVHHAPVGIDSEEAPVSHVARALCLATAGDGRTGVGWTEWNRPLAGPARR